MAVVATQSLPTTSTDGRDATVTMARMMLRLVGAGWQAPDGSNNAADALALAASFADLREELLNVWANELPAFATSDNGLLTEWEILLGLQPDRTSTDTVRQTRLLAFARATLAGTPDSIESAVAAYTGTAEVVETDSVTVWASDPTPTSETRRGVFQFAIVVDMAYAQYAQVEISAIVNRMKPAHTNFAITNQATGFLTDDPNSLTDLTVLIT